MSLQVKPRLKKQSEKVISTTSTNAAFLSQSVIPRQVVGRRSTVERSFLCRTTAEVEAAYLQLKLLLLDVSGWDRLLRPPAAAFFLRDRNGILVHRQARTDDLFQIKIPGPAPVVGHGFDWVRLKDVTERRTADTEMFYFTASPCRDPLSDESSTAHFLRRCASTTFMVVKDNLQVTLLIASRNEVPNSQSGPFPNRWRNRLVGLLAGLFFSKWQWSKLADALVRAAAKAVDERYAQLHVN